MRICSCSLKEEPYGFCSEKNFYKTAANAECMGLGLVAGKTINMPGESMFLFTNFGY